MEDHPTRCPSISLGGIKGCRGGCQAVRLQGGAPGGLGPPDALGRGPRSGREPRVRIRQALSQRRCFRLGESLGEVGSPSEKMHALPGNACRNWMVSSGDRGCGGGAGSEPEAGSQVSVAAQGTDGRLPEQPIRDRSHLKQNRLQKSKPYLRPRPSTTSIKRDVNLRSVFRRNPKGAFPKSHFEMLLLTTARGRHTKTIF